MQVNGQLHGSQLAVRACTHKNRTREAPASGFFMRRRALRLRTAAFPEKHRDAPEASDADDRVDHAADARGLATEDPRDQIEPRESHESPVDSADNGEDQAKCIHTSISLILESKIVWPGSPASCVFGKKLEIAVAFTAGFCIMNIEPVIFLGFHKFF